MDDCLQRYFIEQKNDTNVGDIYKSRYVSNFDDYTYGRTRRDNKRKQLITADKVISHLAHQRRVKYYKPSFAQF